MTMISGPAAHEAIGLRNRTGLTAFLRRFFLERSERSQLKQRRQAFRNLLDLDDKTLADIGFTRYEVEDAASLPLNVNASLALREMARQRRAQEHRGYRG